MEGDRVSDLLGRMIASEHKRLDKIRRLNRLAYGALLFAALVGAGLMIFGAVTGI